VKKTYSNVRGTSDFDAAQSLLFQDTLKKSREVFKRFNYQEIILPLLEERDLFVKGVGQNTEIVEKQMFKIEGKDIVLRPEGTAQVIRYYLQNALFKKSDFSKFFYTGAMFRGERPQKGRLRQFHHIGAEAIGSDSYYLDAEIIDLSLKILDSAGIKERRLLLNSLGCQGDKEKFALILKDELPRYKEHLCEDCRRRLGKNPLRILDCKKQRCRQALKDFVAQTGGPHAHLCLRCLDNFKNLTLLLDDLQIKYILDFSLVRGLDYYTNTVFEITSPRLGAQDAIGAGGRYNNLVKLLGGPDTPAVGFALGVERMLLVLGQSDCQQTIDVFVALTGSSLAKIGFDILSNLRQNNLTADYDYCGKSLKGQLRAAQKKNARYVVIVGDEEWKNNCVLLKDMAKGTQEKVKINDLINKIM